MRPEMLDGLSIRTGTREDIDGVLDVWARAGANGALPDTPAALRALIDWNGDALVVAELDGELVGTLIAAWDGWRGNMYRLAVLPEHQQKGIAARLVEAARKRLYEQGARRVTALVREGDERATATWRSTGYGRDEDVARFVRNL
jgi:ribosomal protein S18 acetylase RimI-like enzyme